MLFWHYLNALRAAGHNILHLMLAPASTDLRDYVASMGRDPAIEVEAHETGPIFAEGLFGHTLIARGLDELRARARRHNPDGVVAFDLNAAWALGRIDGAPRIVWLGDLNFESQKQHALYGMREDFRRAPHSALRLLMARAWRRVYRQVLADDGLVASSYSSVAALADLGLNAVYEPYPWPGPDGVLEISPPRLPSFAFFGGLEGLGSRSALHFCFDKLLPALRAEWGIGGFRLLFAGSGVLPAWAQARIAHEPEIERLGFVDDLARMLAGCHGMLAPIDVPVGNRSRIVTAMAIGSPIVAHANAALGNPDLVDGKTCLLARDAAGFAARMRRLVEAPDEARRLAQAARRVYDAAFSPAVAGARFVAIVKDWISSAGRDPLVPRYFPQRWPA
ncbi:MAG: glycosyltransferase [Magnetospirillum sp.]|nr:glycosyltransferase [Magnetospirillum sp.]